MRPAPAPGARRRPPRPAAVPRTRLRPPTATPHRAPAPADHRDAHGHACPAGDLPLAAADHRHPATRDPAGHPTPMPHPRDCGDPHEWRVPRECREPRGGKAGTGRDRGQAAIEFAGWIGFLLIAALAAIQLGIVAYAAQQAGTAARAAARVASQGGDGEAAGHGAMSGWLADGASISAPPGGEDVTATVTVSIPTVLPLLSFDPVTRTTTMPVTTSEGGTS